VLFAALGQRLEGRRRVVARAGPHRAGHFFAEWHVPPSCRLMPTTELLTLAESSRSIGNEPGSSVASRRLPVTLYGRALIAPIARKGNSFEDARLRAEHRYKQFGEGSALL
jgi:hypothetical protein